MADQMGDGKLGRWEVEKQQRLKATFAELLAAIAAGFSSEMEQDAIYLIKFYPFSTVLSVIVCLGLLDFKKNI